MHMTTAYDPRREWRREDRETLAFLASVQAVQPAILAGPLVDGDLCEIRLGRRYCHQDGVVEARDANGRHRVLCAEHRDLYFPAFEAVAS